MNEGREIADMIKRVAAEQGLEIPHDVVDRLVRDAAKGERGIGREQREVDVAMWRVLEQLLESEREK